MPQQTHELLSLQGDIQKLGCVSKQHGRQSTYKANLCMADFALDV